MLLRSADAHIRKSLQNNPFYEDVRDLLAGCIKHISFYNESCMAKRPSVIDVFVNAQTAVLVFIGDCIEHCFREARIINKQMLIQ